MHHDPSTPRVVHITNTSMFLNHFRGQPEFFRKHGFEFEAISPAGGDLVEFGRREGVPVYAVGMTRTITPLRDLATVYRLWRLLRRLRPTIVHAHTPKGGIVGMAAAWLSGVPVRIYHLHGLPRMTAGRAYRRLLQWSGQLTGRLAHRVLCVSDSVRRAALDQRLFPADKARVLARGSINGLDSAIRFNPALVGREAGARMREALGIPLNARVLGYIGRVVLDKGVVELAVAWRDLRQSYPDLHLIIAGPFELEDSIPGAIQAELASDSRVHLIAGWVDDIPPYYAAMDLLTLPSYREGLGYVLLEAAAMGLPVVATAVTGCVDAVEDGVTGTLVPSHDAPALTKAIMAYMDNPRLCQEHGRAGRERIVREFDQQEAWEALLWEYRELLVNQFGSVSADVAHEKPPRRC